MTSTPTTSVQEDELQTALIKFANEAINQRADFETIGIMPGKTGVEMLDEVMEAAKSYGNHRELEGRIEENDSLLDVAEHEIKTGQWCLNHDKYVSQCAACRRRFMFYTVCDELKLVISERKAELESQKENPNV